MTFEQNRIRSLVSSTTVALELTRERMRFCSKVIPGTPLSLEASTGFASKLTDSRIFLRSLYLSPFPIPTGRTRKRKIRNSMFSVPQLLDLA
jgi:hypothetical protein